MKIEMAESLAMTWLRHEKKCFMVQQNWSASTFWDEDDERGEEIEGWIEELKMKLDEWGLQRFDLFKKNNGFNQLKNNIEVDVLGLVVGPETRYYCVESAFHEGGLNYSGGSVATAAKVVSKLIKNALIIYYYTGLKNTSCTFLSPRVNDAVLNHLRELFPRVKAFMAEKGFAEENFELIFNDDFKMRIINQILDHVTSEVSDDNELCLRAIQLLGVFKNRSRNNAARPSGEAGNNDQDPTDMKIGKLVRTVMIPILETAGRITEEELADLVDKTWSKQTFDLNYPTLMSLDEWGNSPIKSHYYAKNISVCGRSYKVCQEWYRHSLGLVQNWINQHLQEE